MFNGFDPKDGAALYDTKESALERAKMLVKWGDDPSAKIMLHREWVPLWLARLVQNTWFEWVGYTESLSS